MFSCFCLGFFLFCFNSFYSDPMRPCAPLYFLRFDKQEESQHILAAPSEEVQQYVKNGSRAIRGRVFPEYVCIEDVDKIISSVQRAPEEAAGWGEPGKHLTASETRFTPIDRPTTSVRNGKRPRLFIVSQRRTHAHTRKHTHNSAETMLVPT